MGASESKLTIKREKEDVLNLASAPSTPTQIVKSKEEDFSHLDPRSPSDNIIRTPLEILTKLTSHADEETVQTSILICAIDPRSPTDQFARTPIIFKDTSSQPPKLHNKILDNARRSILYTPTATSKTDQVRLRPNITPPKLLGSSVVTRRNSQKRKSYVGLLETNIDYRETDLDSYIKNKSLNSSLTINVTETDSPLGSILKCEDCDPRSPSTDFLRTPIQIVTKIGEIDLNNTVEESSLVNKENDEINCDKTESLLKIFDKNAEKVEMVDEISVNDIHDENEISVGDENNEALDNIVLKNDDNCSEKMIDIVNDLIDHVVTLTSVYDEESRQDISEVETIEIKEPIIDLTADVQEFGRKLTKIIYEEDKSLFQHINKNDFMEQPRNRTPMKDRNAITEPKKNKLKVSDKPRKTDYAVSKIPVFREKKGSNKRVQCENTPPRNMDVRRKKKPNQSLWDSDKTLVI